MSEEKKPNKKTYVITSAQGIQNPYSARMYGRDSTKGKPNLPLIKNMESYAKKENAELQICGIPGAYVNEIELDEFFHKRNDIYLEKNAKKRNEQNREREKKIRETWDSKDPEKRGEFPMHYFWEDIPETDYKNFGQKLNKNAKTFAIPEPPQNLNPLSRKEKFTHIGGGTSIIFPSPKQRLKPVASGQAGDYPKLMITTGSCTYPNYNTTNRTGFFADQEHQYGFTVVDVLNENIFLPRIVPARKNGTFIDLGIKYSGGKKIGKAKTTALIIGDSHVSEINPKVEKANKEMLHWFKSEYTYLHDVFSASSINLHELDDEIGVANKYGLGITNLEEELVLTGNYLKEYGERAKDFGGEIDITYANHNDMLFRWLTRGQYKRDKENRLTAFKILGEGIDRFNCLEKAIKKFVNLPDNVVFLKPGEDRIHWGYQCAAHGHLGKNGSRGSLKNLSEGYGKVFIGHVHQLEIMGDSASAGTSTRIPLEYQLGQPSTSMAGNIVLYEGGLFQGLPIVKGKWRAE